jgi:hypothetical protein
LCSASRVYIVCLSVPIPRPRPIVNGDVLGLSKRPGPLSSGGRGRVSGPWCLRRGGRFVTIGYNFGGEATPRGIDNSRESCHNPLTVQCRTAPADTATPRPTFGTSPRFGIGA